MPQLGSGNSSGYPHVIDTRQLFVNGTPAAPDDATRLDAEVINDALTALINVEHTLGANPQGIYGSVAARLQQHIPGGGGTPPLFAFFEQTVWTIPGTSHSLAAPALIVQAYDNATPHAQAQPMRVTIDPGSYDVVATWAALQSGSLVLGGSPPLYSLAFTNQTALTISGGTHALGTPHFLVAVYSAETPAHLISPASVVINPATYDVTLSFVTPQSGSVLLCAMGPRYVETFTAQTTVTVPGTTHNLESRALLLQLFDENGAFIEPNTLTVHPTTYDVTATFLVAQSGALLLARAVEITGRDFLLIDGGLPNSTAVRVFSFDGGLNLQMGEADLMAFRNRLGAPFAVFTHAGQLGLGTISPAYQLHLTTDSAAKPGTSTWTVASDERLKEVLGPFTDGLETLLALDAVRYRYNGLGGMPTDRQEHVGFLAQAVQAIAPYMVQSYRGRLTPESPDTDILTLNIDALNYVLLNAMKELMALHTTLLARVDTLEVAVAALQGAQP